MKLKPVFMFLGCLLGGAGSFAYWYGSTCVSGDCETGTNLFSVLLYGVFIGLFIADFISQGFSKKEA